ncbi:BamA/TamA family outer membrane protein [Solitalea koreensis]|uniref:Surface antigen n=1 Tax=Solitalea koreensis TaxID=543615 RepID=A0A521D187_9SPHI|nr:BamA/TamA family outer membrane protein [Solitalea koreensis]SMO65438.1 Surface antigen [Solitalea koreensis]
MLVPIRFNLLCLVSVLLLTCIILPHVSFAQISDTSAVPEKDIWDIFKSDKELKLETRDSSKKVHKVFLPVVSYNPSTGFEFGVLNNTAFYLGDHLTTRLSVVNVRLSYTTNKQFFSYIRSNIITDNNRLNFTGDWRWYISSQPTFGLGTQTNAQDDINLDYSLLRFYENVVVRLAGPFYAGAGLYIDKYYNIADHGTAEDPYQQYAEKYGFDPSEYNSNGLGLTLQVDSRDNTINAYKGIYASLGQRFYMKGLGGSSNWSQFLAEFRAYQRLSRNAHRRLAFWVYANLIISGTAPYMSLPAIGWDTYSNAGRGYEQGRFRGKQLVYAETEYRFPIVNSGLLGGVMFVNATTASNDDGSVKLFNTIRPGYGAGLRIKLNKLSRTNITVDYGRGQQNSSGIYFNVQEAF